MLRVATFIALCVTLAGAAAAAAPSEEVVQGLYEGAFKDSQGLHKFEARVVACGKGALQVFIREPLAEGKVGKVTLDGKIEGDAVTFAGKAGETTWTAAYSGGAIKGTSSAGGTIEMKRVERQPPTLGAKPPAGAIVLLDGKNFSEVTKKPGKDGTEPEWQVLQDGGVLVPKGGIASKRTFGGSFKLHVEFKIPFMPAARGQGRGNSGVYLPNGDEIQVLDSFGMTTYTGGGCGGLYKYKDPDAFDEFSLASLPPLQWQTYDVEYRVENKDGKPAGNPRVTVIQNGLKIHDNFELQNPAREGMFHFQDHGCPVEYRNIWVLPLDGR